MTEGKKQALVASDESLWADLDKIDIPEMLPILPLKNVVVYPHMITPLLVGTAPSKKLVDNIAGGDNLLGLVALQRPDAGPTDAGALYGMGTAGRLLKRLAFPDGSIRLLAQGIRRFRILKVASTDPYIRAVVEVAKDTMEDSVEVKAFVQNVAQQFMTLISQSARLPQELQILVMNLDDPGKLADLVASNLDISVAEKQGILETLEVKERLSKVAVLLNKEIEVSTVQSRIQETVQSELGKTQREYFLREQLKAIQKELGEGDDRSTEAEELQEAIEKAKLPEEAKKAAEKELSRLSKMAPGAPDYTVTRTYLDWLVSLPWSASTEDNLDLESVKKILDEDHYDLEKVKERILEFLAVRKLKSDMKGPILCFVGPPGTGKTSLGRSIAHAMGRKFIRISLGGIRDEAEIRGHRRTYIGALPGRIVQGIKKAESNNPIFMLDEIDKLGIDFRGDPSSALLEVLDPEQNFSFSDHYLEVPFDLRKVMFITTANLLDPIPSPLRDRMEVLELPGYTEEEKLSIAKIHLIPKQFGEHGISEKHLRFGDEGLRRIISDYTREAGMRNLEREIAKVCRKVARKVAENGKQQVVLSHDVLADYLGPIRFFSETGERVDQPGVAIGLAWTPTGGEILFVESARMDGGKSLKITGQLGEVMRESVEAAVTIVRSRADSLGIDPGVFENSDFHIHVPAGGVPKDGPSAGVTIATSLVSLLTNRLVRSDIAMTGEITLRGKLLPVGGIKEKVLASRRAGIRTLILPWRNEKDLVEVPEQIRKGMTFLPVDRIEEAWSHALKANGRREAKGPLRKAKRGKGSGRVGSREKGSARGRSVR